ncbi:MAG TPA: hypothetical protein VGB70_03795 [Allosphingosinicella sp.]|jgi:type III secretion protein L
MSGLIKAGSAASIRPFSHRPDEPKLQEAAPAEDPRITALREEVASLRLAVAQHPAALERAKADAKAAGRREAGEAIRQDGEKQLSALRAAIATALKDWDARLAELDGLAALLSKTALAKVFDDDERRAALVGETIARQLRHLRRETVLAVRVSARDFPDAAALQAVAAESGGALNVLADPDLRGGHCRLDLQLGRVDIGPATQWRELAALLDGFMSGEGGR